MTDWLAAKIESSIQVWTGRTNERTNGRTDERRLAFLEPQRRTFKMRHFQDLKWVRTLWSMMTHRSRGRHRPLRGVRVQLRRGSWPSRCQEGSGPLGHRHRRRGKSLIHPRYPRRKRNPGETPQPPRQGQLPRRNSDYSSWATVRASNFMFFIFIYFIICIIDQKYNEYCAPH